MENAEYGNIYRTGTTFCVWNVCIRYKRVYMRILFEIIGMIIEISFAKVLY